VINIPNSLTALRLALTPFVIYGIVSGYNVLSLLLFAVAAATDLFDGMLARRLNMATEFGERLDPVADKVLLSGALLALAFTGSAPWLFVGIVLGRDIFILLAILALMKLTRVRRFPPSIWGKISTFAQIAAVVTIMVGNIYQTIPLLFLSALVVSISIVMTLWSGVNYAWRGFLLLRKGV